MAARSPRRARRQAIPAAALPRPLATDEAPMLSSSTAATERALPRPTLGARAHHVTNDYGYVRRDLLTVAAVGAVVIAFIVGMSFLV